MNHNLEDLVAWLEKAIEEFDFDVIGLKRRNEDLFYPLPTEPGTLAHLIETRAAAFLEETVDRELSEVVFRRGGQRSYPDIELTGGCLDRQIVALDIKAARRAKMPSNLSTERRTQSRITLLTGNTYFATPDEKRRGALRPYGDYALHLDWIIVFSIDVDAAYPEVSDIEQVIAETWQIASKSRSSTTRKYIGAVNAISDLKSKRGEFADRDSFETYWRVFDWSKKATKEEVGSQTEDEQNHGDM